jgi:hypothetical protein
VIKQIIKFLTGLVLLDIVILQLSAFGLTGLSSNQNIGIALFALFLAVPCLIYWLEGNKWED